MPSWLRWATPLRVRRIGHPIRPPRAKSRLTPFYPIAQFWRCVPSCGYFIFPPSFANRPPAFWALLSGKLVRVGSLPLGFILGAHLPSSLGKTAPTPPPIFNQAQLMLTLGRKSKDAHSSQHGQPGEDDRMNWDALVFLPSLA